VTTSLVVQSVGETQGCGKTSLQFLDEETREAKLGQYPSMCNIFTEIRGQRVFLGGASLIQRNQVVTLATLVDRLTTKTEEEPDFNFDLRGADSECGDSQLVARKLSVICGSVDIQGVLDEEAQTSMVSRVLMHPDYSPTQLTNDLAILLVNDPFNYTSSVSQVCLPRPNQDQQSLGERCIAVGHGQDGWPDPSVGFGPTYSRILNQVSLPLWESTKCQEALNRQHFRSKHGFTWKIHPSFLCAGGEEAKDTCRGDGGGPLLCGIAETQSQQGATEQDSLTNILFGGQEDQGLDFDLRGAEESSGSVRLVQAGVTAWGIRCGTAGLPAAYSNLLQGACWMDQIMSCYPTTSIQDLINLRAGTLRGPDSANKLTEGECDVWLRSQGADKAACGCRQRLLEENEAVESPFDIGQSDQFDLRSN